MPIYEIPCCERIISVGKIYRWGKKVEAMSLDGIGFFLHFDEDCQRKDHKLIRSHLRQKVYTEAYIEAKNIYEAVGKFYNEYEGAKVGGQEQEARAAWINKEKIIYELPHCHSMLKNEKGQFICERFSVANDDDHEGEEFECVMCISGHFDDQEVSCVGSIFRELIEGYGKINLNLAARDVGGFKFIELRILTPF